jgi:hypothetical protein
VPQTEIEIIEEGLLYPSMVFGAPANVANDTRLTKEDRLLILENWALTAKLQGIIQAARLLQQIEDAKITLSAMP